MIILLPLVVIGLIVLFEWKLIFGNDIDTVVGWLFGTGAGNQAATTTEIVEPSYSVSVSGATAPTAQYEACRPQTFDDFIGNEAAVGILKREIAGANEFRDGIIRNTILYGPPGTGKTTLAEIVARACGYRLFSTTGSAIKTPLDLYRILATIKWDAGCNANGALIFFDEIHDLMKARDISEGELLTLFERGIFHCASLEGKRLDLVDSGTGIVWSGEIHSPLVLHKRWAVIGATTEPGMLSPAMRRRFPCEVMMRAYTEEDMRKMVGKYEGPMAVEFSADSEGEIAQRARSNPARVISLMQSCQNRVASEGAKRCVDAQLVSREMDAQGIRSNGLTDMDYAVLRALANAPHTKTGDCMGLGITNLASMVGVSSNTITELVEPYLKQLGYLVVGSRRKITDKGLRALAEEDSKHGR